MIITSYASNLVESQLWLSRLSEGLVQLRMKKHSPNSMAESPGLLRVEFLAEKVANLSILPVGELPVFPHVETVSDHVPNKKTRADEGKHARKVFKELIFSL